MATDRKTERIEVDPPKRCILCWMPLGEFDRGPICEKCIDDLEAD
jgi:hypothetical protein